MHQQTYPLSFGNMVRGLHRKRDTADVTQSDHDHRRFKLLLVALMLSVAFKVDDATAIHVAPIRMAS